MYRGYVIGILGPCLGNCVQSFWDYIGIVLEQFLDNFETFLGHLVLQMWGVFSLFFCGRGNNYFGVIMN